MNHVITTYGGGELFTLVFNGIAALFKTDNGILIPLMNLGLTIGLVYVVILMLFRHQLIDGLRWFLWVIVATNLIFLPKTRIHIHDPLNNYHRDVDNVPLALGAFAGLVSSVGKTVTEKFESVFSLPNYMPYHQTGTVFASSLMSQVGQFRIVDPIFKGNMDRFVNQCVVYASLIGNKYTMTDLQNTPNIWKLVTENASPILGFLYKPPKEGEQNLPGRNLPGTIITCKEGATKLSALWEDEIKRATALYGSRVQNRIITANAFYTHLTGSAHLLADAKAWADSATEILKQEMMVKAIEDASNNKLSELGSSSNYAATKALLQQRSTYAIAGDIAARTLPLFKNVIEALSYVLFIFIVVLALLPNGYKILLTYCGILVWTQLWAPLYAVLNLIMTLYGKSETLSHGAQEGLTLLNSAAVINANADMTTLAAWLSVSIPFISYGILKQGAGAFVGLAQHLGSAMQSAASGAAAEAVSGNISLGNVSMGTQAYQNTTAFQHNTSPSYTSSQFKAMSTSGVEQSTFADGTQALNDQGMSNLPVKLIATVNRSFEKQQSLHEAQSMAQSKLVAAGQSMDTAIQQTTNVLERIGSDVLKNDSYTDTLTTNEAKALQDHENFTKDISENLGVTKARANEIAVAVKAGTPEWIPISASGSASLSGSNVHQEQIQEAQALAKQKGYTYSLDSVVSAAHSVMESRNDTEGAELAKGANASLTQAAQLRDEASIARNKVKEISESATSSQRTDFLESREVTQPFLEYVARTPVNVGPGAGSGGTIGMMGANAILRQGGEEFQSYLERFREENPQYSVRVIDVSREQQGLEGQYQTESNKLKADTSIESQHLRNTQKVNEQGKEIGLYSPHASSKNVKATVQKRHEEHTKAIDQRKGEIIAHQAQLQEKLNAAKQETLIVGNLKNVGKSLIGGAESVIEDISSIDPALLEKNITP